MSFKKRLFLCVWDLLVSRLFSNIGVTKSSMFCRAGQKMTKGKGREGEGKGSR